MLRKHIIILVTIAVVFAGSDLATAKAGSSSSSGGSRSSGGSSSGRSSYGNSSSVGKTSSAPASKYGNSASPSSPSSASSSSGGEQSGSTTKKYGNTASTTEHPAAAPAPKYGNTAGTASAGGQAVKPSTYDQKLNATVSKQQAKESLSKYEAQQGMYKSKDTATNYGGYAGNPIVNRSRGYDQNTYAYRRDTFYTTYSYQPPQYVFMGAPSFGMWDAMFLWFMLDHISDRNYSRMYYNHQNDPDIQRWRQETEKLSGENAELKAKLSNLDREVAGLKGQPVDPNYIPPGIDADIALNKKVIDHANPVKKESHVLRWLLILSLAAVLIYYIYSKRKASASSAKFRLD